MAVAQGLAPVFGRNARVLVLGSFPGEASLQAGQYYAHPRNHFWPVLSQLLGKDLSVLAYDERCAHVCTAGIAIWDIYASCHRQGSLDSAIRQASLNDFQALQRQAPQLRVVAINGAQAASQAKGFTERGWIVYRMPSTSPANARLRLEQKAEQWAALRRDGWLP